MKQDCKIIVFAKAPVAGFAKTRLARVIGDQAAALLAARMLQETVAQAVATNLGPVELCCAPDMSHAQFLHEREKHGLVLSEQGEGDLGQRMCRAFERALQQHQRVLLIGTDAPDLRAAQLIVAAHALHEHGAVFAPAHDGGYVLVGLSRPMPALFDGVAWSTSQVMSQTRSKLAELGESWFELPALHDVDEAQDLVHVPESWMSA
jgi:rSAM/selenodomain-associated transferase 1